MLRNADVDTVWHSQRRNEKCCSTYNAFFTLLFLLVQHDSVAAATLEMPWKYARVEKHGHVQAKKTKPTNRTTAHPMPTREKITIFNENKINRRKIRWNIVKREENCVQSTAVKLHFVNADSEILYLENIFFGARKMSLYSFFNWKFHQWRLSLDVYHNVYA